jgi:hypothetical protein
MMSVAESAIIFASSAIMVGGGSERGGLPPPLRVVVNKLIDRLLIKYNFS